jgi:uncharacterized SAM-binding protein YcdF (DUF218 family)
MIGRFFAFLFVTVIVGLAAAWVAGLVWFASSLPDQPDDPNTRTDAIVVLTGGQGRFEEGVTLLRQGWAQKLFVSGVEPGVEVPEMLKKAHLVPAPSDADIVLGHDADSTASNAAETSDWMHGQGYHSLRLVTASYHMPRSLMEFHHAMPELTIVPHPVFPGAVKQRWWAWPGTAQLIAQEYVKYLVAAASLKFVGDQESP